jgi:outer membrane biosynthesis protein TonB
MYDIDFELDREKNKNKSYLLTVIIHTAILLLFFINFFQYQWPPKDESGILVALGQPDEGQGEDLPLGDPQVQDPTPTPPTQEPAPSSSPDKADKNTNVATPSKVKENKTIDEKSDIPNTNTKKAQAEKEAENLAEKRRREAEIKAKEEEERKAAEAEAKRQEEIANSKKKFGSLFGKGQGNTGNPGSQGDPKGDPNSKVLEGIGKGSGQIGGGLANRGVTYTPKFNDSSQKTGKVVIAICVDNNGKVIKADFTQKGSTTTDSELIAIAKKGALAYKFSTAEVESQCGTVTVDFRLK